MAPMLAAADAAGLRTYLEATPAGGPLYEALGFRHVDDVALDLREAAALGARGRAWDELEGEEGGVVRMPVMIREVGGGGR